MIGLVDLVQLAARGVLRNRRRTLITGAMVVLGVAAVVFSRGFIAGLQSMITDSLVDIRFGSFEVARRGYHASVDMAPLDLLLPDHGTIRDELAHTPGVVDVAARLRFVGMIAKGDESQVFSGTGLDARAESRVCPKGPATRDRVEGGWGKTYQLVDGEGLGDREGVVLGVELAETLGAKVGDTVTLVAQTRSGSVDAADVKVLGLFRWDDANDNRHSLVVPLALAQKLVHAPAQASVFAVRLEDPMHVAGAIDVLRTRLADDTELVSWLDLGPYYRDVMTLQDRVLGLVLAVIVALLVLGVANTTLMAIYERRREIGTLLCVGIERRHIVRLFLFEASMLALMAGVLGVAFGCALTSWAHHVGISFFIPAVGTIVNRPMVDGNYAVIAFSAASAAMVVAASYPAWRASRLAPVVAVRAV